jgi:hypothetical protein
MIVSAKLEPVPSIKAAKIVRFIVDLFTICMRHAMTAPLAYQPQNIGPDPWDIVLANSDPGSLSLNIGKDFPKSMGPVGN